MWIVFFTKVYLQEGKMMQDEHLGGPPRQNIFSQAIGRISQLYQRYLDLWTPHVVSRWTVAILLIILFILRVFLSQVGSFNV